MDIDKIIKSKLIKNPYTGETFELKSSTPADLLAKYGVHRTTVLATGSIYKKATYVCDQCDYKEDVLLGYTEAVYHECNQGNVVFRVNQKQKGEIE